MYILLVVLAKEFEIGLPSCAAKSFTLDFHFLRLFCFLTQPVFRIIVNSLSRHLNVRLFSFFVPVVVCTFFKRFFSKEYILSMKY